MEKLQLPDGAWASIRPKSTVTERQSRQINRALLKMMVPSRKLRAAVEHAIGKEALEALEESLDGVRVEDVTEEQKALQAKIGEARMGAYSLLTEEEIDDLEGYDAVVTAVMTEAWSMPDPITPASVLNIPSHIFTPLAKLAMEEWDKVIDFSVDGSIDDPKTAGASDSVS
jgi:hypothetical protein